MKQIERSVRELKVGDIVYSTKKKQFFVLQEFHNDRQSDKFTSLVPKTETLYDVYYVVLILLVYPIEMRKSIFIDWKDVENCNKYKIN